MLTVRDLLAAPTLSDARSVFADEMGYDKVVTGFGTFDVEALLGRYWSFRPDEVVATGLSFSGGDPEKAASALIALMESGISGIFIKDTLFKDVSDDVKAKARETETPFFFFSKAYMEDMVTEIRTMFHRDEEEERRRVVIDDLMNARAVPERRRLFCDTTGLMGGCVACAAFVPATSIDAMTVRAVTESLDEEAKRDSEIGCFVCQYKRGWVALVAGDDTPEEMNAHMGRLCNRFMEVAGIPLACGLGNAVLLENVDESIVQALQAVESPQAAQGICRWRESGWAAFRGAAKDGRLFSGQGAYVRGKLSAYDAAHDADLLETVRAFVHCGGVVQRTADELHLHPNSVRNRVVRAAEVLGMQDEPERALFAYFTVMLLDEC